VLTEAALAGAVDTLVGLKENVILGHLIPAGTAFNPHLNLRIKHLAEPPALPEEPARPAAPAAGTRSDPAGWFLRIRPTSIEATEAPGFDPGPRRFPGLLRNKNPKMSGKRWVQVHKMWHPKRVIECRTGGGTGRIIGCHRAVGQLDRVRGGHHTPRPHGPE
jgi:hypothetical protein